MIGSTWNDVYGLWGGGTIRFSILYTFLVVLSILDARLKGLDNLKQLDLIIVNSDQGVNRFGRIPKKNSEDVRSFSQLEMIHQPCVRIQERRPAQPSLLKSDMHETPENLLSAKPKTKPPSHTRDTPPNAAS